MRHIGQSAVLAAGAWLVIDGQATMGIMMASTILVGRIFGPIEAVLRDRYVIAASMRAAGRLLNPEHQTAGAPAVLDGVLLEGPLRVQRLRLAPTRTSERTFGNVTFAVEPGQLLVVTDGTGSGKSLLLRALAGLHPPAQGVLRLGEVQYGLIESELMERMLGFLPQENLLLPGTIAETIARHDPAVPLINIVEAAKQVDLHERILSFRDSYHTRVYPEGVPLPFSFARRLTLARAICHRPRLLLLDDPFAGLDTAGIKVVADIVKRQRARGNLCVVAANPPVLLDVADNVLVLGEGKAPAYGSPTTVFERRPVRVARKSDKARGDHGT